MNAIKVLLVEDNEGDILLTLEALETGKIPKETKVLKDGWEAVRYMEKQEPYEASETPDVVVLDVNLPKVSGYEVLDKIKNNSMLRHIPIVMLTTSSSPDDIIKSYQKQADHYIAKPFNADDYFRVVNSLEDFWFSHNTNKQ